jgi:hypothetical protein
LSFADVPYIGLGAEMELGEMHLNEVKIEQLWEFRSVRLLYQSQRRT